MKTNLIFIFSLFLFNFIPLPPADTTKIQEEMTTYFFIRHAEKDTSDPKNRDPELSPAGIKRVEKWAEIFKETRIDQVYTTNYTRTRRTAASIADTKDLKVKFYDPTRIYDEDFRKNTKGKTVLVVGHSNTNPLFVNSILGEQKYQDINEAESGSLFIVSVSPSGATTSQLLYIN